MSRHTLPVSVTLASALLATGCGGGGGGGSSGEWAALAALAAAQQGVGAPAPAPAPAEPSFVPAENRELLFQQAQEEGYAAVMLHLVAYSLGDLGSISETVRREAVERRMSAVRALLGNQALREGEWVSAMGQAGVMVTAEGVRMLERSGLVLAIHWDSTRSTSDLVWFPQDHREVIQSTLNAQGSMEVELALNSEIGYRLAADASTVYLPSSQAATEQSRLLNELVASLAGQRLVVLDDAAARQGKSGVVRVRMDRIAWYGIRRVPQVRAILAPGVETQAQWPTRVLDQAVRDGRVEVILSLRNGKSFSALSGYMSQAAIAVQRQAHQAVFDDLLAGLGGAVVSARLDPEGGSAGLILTRAGIEALYARKDPRILAISPNEPVAWLGASMN